MKINFITEIDKEDGFEERVGISCLMAEDSGA
jgi:hypothetical protein